MISLSVIIVNYRSEEYLAPCLESLAKHRPAVSFEVILVDNASPSWGDFKLPVLDFPVTVLRQDTNTGFSRANNRGLRQAQGELILFLNPDTVIAQPGALDRLIAILTADETIGAVAPRLSNPDGSLQITASKFYQPMHLPFIFDGVASRVFPAGFEPWIRLYRHYDRVQAVDWAVMAALLVRRRVCDEIDGLDERFFLFAEDADFCRRLRQRGYRVIYEPAAVVMHHGFGSAGKDHARHCADLEQGQRTYYEIHYPAAAKYYFAFRDQRRVLQAAIVKHCRAYLGDNTFSRLVIKLLLVPQLAAELLLTIGLQAQAMMKS